MDDDSKPIFFWKPTGPYDWMSNWSNHTIEFGGIILPTAEHYIMFMKAGLFGDKDKMNQIAAAPTPREAKRLGRKVNNFDEAKWESAREPIAYGAVSLKATQHPEVRLCLLTTGNRLIAEASGHDAIWGIGHFEAAAKNIPPEQWRGQNLLGKAWMLHRDKILYDILYGVPNKYTINTADE